MAWCRSRAGACGQTVSQPFLPFVMRAVFHSRVGQSLSVSGFLTEAIAPCVPGVHLREEGTSGVCYVTTFADLLTLLSLERKETNYK